MNKTWKSNIIIGLKVVSILGFAVLFISIMISASYKMNEVICTDVEVGISEKDNLKFIDEQDLMNYINNYGQSILINQRIKDIDKAAIEARIEENSYVEKAEVFSNFEGSIKVDVKQKLPIYRVFNNKGVSYYVSDKGQSIPISTKFTPRLIVATGNIPNDSNMDQNPIHQDLSKIVRFISADKFWDAMIGQIHVADNGDFILYSKIAEHSILLGSTANLEDKFRYLRIFYKEALKNVDWKIYSRINLKYQGQIICTKK
ncbi:MAG: hypothetical protein KDC82_02530 [Bacteroidetes bacterium]|nr:hypothetical protein [Bacteroidota bacterium]